MDPSKLTENILESRTHPERAGAASDQGPSAESGEGFSSRAGGTAELDRKSSGKLRDSYIGRIPEEERAISVKFAWHELWSKVIS